MKKLIYFAYILLISFMLILESTVFFRLDFFNIRPNLVLVITLMITFFLNRKESIIFGLISGGLEDFFIGRMIGINIISTVSTILIIRIFSDIVKKNLIIFTILVFFGSVLNSIIIGILIALVGNIELLNFMYFKDMVLGSLYNSCIFAIIYPLNYFIFRKQTGDIK